MLRAARRAKHLALLTGYDLRAEAQAIGVRSRSRTVLRDAARQLELPALPRSTGSVWAVAMVRDEQDVLGGTIRQLLSQGVDHVLVVDNLSGDGTGDLLADLAAQGSVHAGRDRSTAYHQAATMTLLMDAARAAGARWVVPFDADERWMGKGRPLAEVLRSTSAPMVRAELVNAFPDPVREGEWRLDPAPHPDPKIAVRPRRRTTLQMGNHGALRSGSVAEGLGIVHLPWRSYPQFRAKVRHGAQALAAAGAAPDAGWHWQRLGAMEEEELMLTWRRLLAGLPVPENAWHPGPVTVPFPLDEPLTWDAVLRARSRPTPRGSW